MHGGGGSVPNPGQVFPSSELFALNLGHVYAQGVESSPESEARFSEVRMLCLKSGARLCTSGRIFPQSGADFCMGCKKANRIQDKQIPCRNGIPKTAGKRNTGSIKPKFDILLIIKIRKTIKFFKKILYLCTRIVYLRYLIDN